MNKKIKPYFRIRYDRHGGHIHACAIERVTEYCSYDILHLATGSKRNELMIKKVVKTLNGLKTSWPDSHFTKIRKCDTCAKRGKGGCAVLVEMVGMNGPCWAWTDNPNWETEAEEDITAYVVAHPDDESITDKEITFKEGVN